MDQRSEEEETSEVAVLQASTPEGGTSSPGMLAAGRGDRRTRIFWGLRKKAALPTLRFPSGEPHLDSGFQSCQVTDVCCFEPLSWR